MDDEPIALAHVVAARNSSPVSIGRRLGRAITAAQWISEVGAWMGVASSHPGAMVALHITDSLSFSAALFGVWCAGKTAVLPGDALPATRDRLAIREIPLLDDETEAGRGIASHPFVGPEFIQFSPAILQNVQHAVILYTSGSTGVPVEIPKRLSQLDCEIQVLERTFSGAFGKSTAYPPDLTVNATVGHHHIYGLLFKVLWPLASERPIIAETVSFPAEIGAALSECPTILISSPAHLDRLALEPSLGEQAPIATFSSGGPLAESAALAWLRRFGAAPIEVYGSSETGGIGWRQRRFEGDEWWTVFNDVRLEISDTATRIWSPKLLNSPDQLCDRLIDGDAAASDGLQTFRLLGRTDRIVKVEGKRVSLDQIESLLGAHPLVAQARVVMLEHPRKCLGAVVALRDEGLAKPSNELRGLFKRCLEKSVDSMAIPKRWRLVAALPVNEQGKTTQALLHGLFESGAPDNASKPFRASAPVVTEQNTASGRVELAVMVPAELAVFEGHFPSHPVLPGVVILQWVVTWGRDFFGLQGPFSGMDQVKFQHVVRPGTSISVSLDYDEGLGRLRFRIFSSEGTHASGRLQFGPPS